jgi:hypothetical protein
MGYDPVLLTSFQEVLTIAKLGPSVYEVALSSKVATPSQPSNGNWSIAIWPAIPVSPALR